LIGSAQIAKYIKRSAQIFDEFKKSAIALIITSRT